MKHLNNEQGFTLVELLIALAILAIGLLGLAGMQINAISSNKFANRLSCMISVGQGVMEDIMARSSSDSLFDTAASNVTYDLDSGSSATSITAPAAGTISATYSISPNTPTTNVTRVIVTVTAGSRTISLTSYKRASG